MKTENEIRLAIQAAKKRFRDIFGVEMPEEFLKAALEQDLADERRRFFRDVLSSFKAIDCVKALEVLDAKEAGAPSSKIQASLKEANVRSPESDGKTGDRGEAPAGKPSGQFVVGDGTNPSLRMGKAELPRRDAPRRNKQKDRAPTP